MLFSESIFHLFPVSLPAAQLAHELFGVTVEPAQNEHTWHPDVRFFSLKKDGQQKAFFYLDPYSRPAGALVPPSCAVSPAMLFAPGKLAALYLILAGASSTLTCCQKGACQKSFIT